MATICFRPPPLPPNKKSTGLANGKNKKQSTGVHGLLSSTYLSFRDPAEDEIITVREEIEMVDLKSVKKCRRVSHTNSLRKNRNSRVMLSRSHSEGNLDKQCGDQQGFDLNRYMKVLSGSWRNLLNLGGMSRPAKPAPTAKKVAPPAVPLEFRHSGSSFGSSAGYGSGADEGGGGGGGGGAHHQHQQQGGGLIPSAGAVVVASGGDTTGIPRDDHSDYGSTVSGGSGSGTGKSPGPVFGGGQSAFPFPPGGGGGGGGQPPPPPPAAGTIITHKAAVYYHHQLSLQEDQGIDMTQSPGRDSPGSSSGSAGSGSRHSTASLDSGRASSYHPGAHGSGGGGGRGGGSSTAGSSGSPRCSLSSSCSIGSASTAGAADHHQARIERMIHQGVPDQEIIHSWLVDLQFEEYFPLFISAGYDLPTIGRMTPEDLTAIGIKKPNHRKRLKAEIAQLNLPDNLPEFIPGSLEEWLSILRLEEYLPAFIEQGYQTIDAVTQLAWEDLEEFGIVKLGHQKKIMLAIKRIKDVKAGKRINSDRIYATREDVLVHCASPSAAGVQQQYLQHPGQQEMALLPPPPHVHATFRSFHQPWEVDQTRSMARGYPPFYYTDIVPIKIRTGRGKSLESLEDPTERTHHTFSPENTQTFYYQQPIGWRPRSYDDGDITPTNETGLFYEGGGTLPRPRGVIRPRPIAKITAKARESFPDFEKPQFNPEKYASPQYKTLPREYIQYGSPLLAKKIPPNPPKRCDDNPGVEQLTTTVEIHHHGPTHHHLSAHHHPTSTSSPLPLPAYPSSDSLSISLEEGQALPPPPAPGTPPGASANMVSSAHQQAMRCKLNSSQSWGAGEEQELINSLALQHRNGSDASFKSSSSTESDSLPFANENAGTIRNRAASVTTARQSEYCSSSSRVGLPPSPANRQQARGQSGRSEPADVLNDIGNMLANLTDELDAMLEEEKRQQQQ